MSIQMEAVYEDGVFRPLQPVPLAENQRVTVTIDAAGAESTPAADAAHFVLSPERWQAFCDALDAPPRDVPALRKLLTGVSHFDSIGDEPAVILQNDRPVAVMPPVAGADLETLALTLNPQFLAILECSRTRQADVGAFPRRKCGAVLASEPRRHAK